MNDQPPLRTAGQRRFLSIGATALVMVLVLLLFPPPAVAGYAGQPLAEVLQDLQRRGLKLVYSTRVVRLGMRVETEPRAKALRAILDEVLAPHGLEARPVPGGRLAVVKAAAEHPASAAQRAAAGGVAPRPPAPPAEPLRLAEAAEEITVTASYQLYGEEPKSGSSLSREEIFHLPHFGEDTYRALTLLPGTASNDLSSRFSVRGGLHPEILVRLDGLELFDPFHFKDIQGLFSIIDPEILDRVELLPSAFPAHLGDRMSGVLDMSSALPPERTLRLGLSLTNASISGGGHRDGATGWSASARRGYLDLVLVDQGDEAYRSRYWDAFLRLDHALNPAHRLSVSVLGAGDTFQFRDRPPGEEGRLDSDYDNAYLRLQHSGVAASRALVESQLFVDRVDGNRDISSLDGSGSATGRDRRRLDVGGLEQHWTAQHRQHLLRMGCEARRYEARFRYQNQLSLTSPIASIRYLPAVGSTVFDGERIGEHYACYVSDRLHLGSRAVLELGGRYDHQRLTGEEQLSPRLNLVVDAHGWGTLRFGWGYFHQSQRPYELDVQDGETELASAERAEHLTLGWERSLGPRHGLRIDAYHRRITDPRPRYENLLDPFSAFPEAEPDRVRIAAEHAQVGGVEVFLSRAGGGGGFFGRVDGWLSYAYGRAEERVGGRDQPRFMDQRHTVKILANLRLSTRWNLSLVWLWHSGLPTTTVDARLGEDGTVVVELGPRYGARLPSFRRTDLRISRRQPFRNGELTFFLDAQNVFNTENIRGFDHPSSSFRVAADGTVTYRPDVEVWPGVLPSFGVALTF